MNPYICLIMLAVLLLSGCGSAPVDDQEGGITGTGNAVLCDDEERKKKQKLCNSKK